MKGFGDEGVFCVSLAMIFSAVTIPGQAVAIAFRHFGRLGCQLLSVALLYWTLTTSVSAEEPSLLTKPAIGGYYYTEWKYTSEEVAPTTILAGKHDRYRIARLWPVTSYRLESPIYEKPGKELVGPSSLLMGLTGNGVLACEMVRPKGHENIACLVDQDDNGNFEGYFKYPAGFEYLMNGIGFKNKRIRKLLSPVEYFKIEDFPEDEKIDFYLYPFLDVDNLFAGPEIYINYCVERSGLSDIWGGERINRHCLTRYVQAPVKKLPIIDLMMESVISVSSTETGEVVFQTKALKQDGVAKFR